MQIVGVMNSGAILVEMSGKEVEIFRSMASSLKRLENGSDGVVRLKPTEEPKKS